MAANGRSQRIDELEASITEVLVGM